MNSIRRTSPLSVSLPKRVVSTIKEGDEDMELIVMFQADSLRVSINSSNFDEGYVLTLFASILYDGSATPAGVHWSEEINSLAEALEEDYSGQYTPEQIHREVEETLSTWVNDGTLEHVQNRITSAIKYTPDISRLHHYYPITIETVGDFNSSMFSVTLIVVFD